VTLSWPRIAIGKWHLAKVATETGTGIGTGTGTRTRTRTGKWQMQVASNHLEI